MAHVHSAYDEKLESILRCAASVFAEKGYHQASIRDIARATHVSLSGLYYYFQSKEELLFLIQDHALGTLLADLDRLLADVDEPEAKLRVLMENHLRYFLANRAEMKVLAHEVESLSGDYRRTVLDQKRRLTEIASGVLQELTPDSGFDPRVAVFSLFGMMNWIYTWYRPEYDVPVEHLADQMSRLFLHGYTTRALPPAGLAGGLHVPPARGALR
jgi:AcrR family transcriptional regulator